MITSEIKTMLLQGKNTVIYGDVRFGANVILEDTVVIGHPKRG